jgi:Zn-finger nucleic acid-binding protein
VSDRPRQCPDCHVDLSEVSARARTGYLLALDQCGHCGGVWFDRWELFPLADEEVGRLEAVDTEKLRAAVDESVGPGKCPQCAIHLRRFRDPVLPPDARVERCAVCEGMWLRRGQLSKVRKTDETTSSKRDQQIRALAAHYGKEADWSKVSDLDAATHTVERGAPSAADVGEILWSTAPWIILQVLFKMLLRR